MRIFRWPALAGIVVAALTLVRPWQAADVALVGAVLNGAIAYAVVAVLLVAVRAVPGRR